MEALFLIIWFYLYVGLLFGMFTVPLGCFPKVNGWLVVLGWPVFLVIYMFNWLKNK